MLIIKNRYEAGDDHELFQVLAALLEEKSRDLDEMPTVIFDDRLGQHVLHQSIDEMIEIEEASYFYGDDITEVE